MPYSAFVSQVTSDNVASARIVGDQISGAFVHHVVWPDTKPKESPPSYSAFRTTFPSVVGDPSLMPLLAGHHVIVEVETPSPPWFSLLLTSGLLAQIVVSLVEGKAAGQVFAIWTQTWADLKVLQADVVAWPVPSLAIVRGTLLGAIDFASYFPSEPGRLALHNGQRADVPREQWRFLWKISLMPFCTLGLPLPLHSRGYRPSVALTPPTWRCESAGWR